MIIQELKAVFLETIRNKSYLLKRVVITQWNFWRKKKLSLLETKLREEIPDATDSKQHY